MAHNRTRHLLSRISRDLKWSPAVGIFGLRQVGKTTLAEGLVEKLRGDYETFDRITVLEASKMATTDFCTRGRLLCIDEAQKGPWVFPAIKDIIGTQRKPCQFLLTGSVRFTLKKEVRESLTGRIILHELLPFTLSEVEQLSSSSLLKSVFDFITPGERKINDLLQILERMENRVSEAQVMSYIVRGGLPVPLFTRDNEKRKAWFASYIETLLTRDLVLVDERLSKVTFRDGMGLLRVLALQQGMEPPVTHLSDSSGLRPSTVARVLSALHALGVIDSIPAEMGGSKPKKHGRIHWKDSGLWSHVLGFPSEEILREQGLRLLIAGELHAQSVNLSSTVYWTFFRSRDGSQIPWIFRAGNKIVAVGYSPTESPSPYELRALRRFLDRKRHSVGIVLGPKKMPLVSFGPRLIGVPYLKIF